jgi:protoporphyrinogen oxidase
MQTKQKTAIIIGAGPAGLTAAYELLTKTNIKPIIIEKSNHIGGISKTIDYKGNKIDIGGHRFFSKSNEIMELWLNLLPRENSKSNNDQKDVMLLRSRKSSIYFNNTFFDYPIKISLKTVYNWGITKSFSIGLNYFKQILFPIKKERNLEEFFTNKFGKKLYLMFFKSYTEKVWGISCKKLSQEWGAQRIKTMSIYKVISHSLLSLLPYKKKEKKTSLASSFFYPKYGAGQIWEKLAKKVISMGGEIRKNSKVKKIEMVGKRVKSVRIAEISGNDFETECDYLFSSMPINHLISSIETKIPKSVCTIGKKLMYRDFVIVGILAKNKTSTLTKKKILDNWIYLQQKTFTAGRILFFNNWSPHMTKLKNNIWIGVEFFCFKNDKIWNKTDENLIDMAIAELEKIGITNKKDLIDGTVIREEKAYPIYAGAYHKFYLVKNFFNKIENLYPIGRNGMHRYNNMDHSMLTAMESVKCVTNGGKNKDKIWDVNSEKKYHESK